MKKIVLLLILICAVPKVAAADYQYCKTMFEDENYSKAIDCFSERLRSNPKDSQSDIWLAASYYYDKQYEKAYNQYKQIVQKYPNTPQGDYAKKEAAKVYQKINYVKDSKTKATGNYISDLKIGTKWTKMPIKVWIEQSQYTNSTKQAFVYWQQKTNNTVTFSYVNKPNEANIKVRYVDKLKNTSSHESFGVTFLQYIGKKNISAEIELLKKTKSNNAFTNKQMFFVSLHEVGHALGINGHSKNNNDVMYFNTNTTSYELSSRDINTIKAIYSNK